LLLLLSLLLFYDIWKNGKRTKATVTDLFQSSDDYKVARGRH